LLKAVLRGPAPATVTGPGASEAVLRYYRDAHCSRLYHAGGTTPGPPPVTRILIGTWFGTPGSALASAVKARKSGRRQRTRSESELRSDERPQRSSDRDSESDWLRTTAAPVTPSQSLIMRSVSIPERAVILTRRLSSARVERGPSGWPPPDPSHESEEICVRNFLNFY
jgi:hypothetical protein